MKLKYFGRILGVLGLVILLSTGLTWLIGAPSSLALGKVLLALCFFIAYLVTNWGELGASASSKGTFFFLVSTLSTLMVVGLIVAGNYVAARHPKTWDFTKNQIHSLAPDTLKTIEGLKQDVVVYAFFRPGEQAYDAARELFANYEEHSKHFRHELIDPAKDPMRVEQLGIREGGARIVVKLGQTESRIQDLNEEALTNAIVKVTHSAQKKVYFTTGHGEGAPDDEQPTGLSEIRARMENEGLQAEKLSFVGLTEIPRDAEALVIAGPAKPFQPNEVALLHSYLDAGGKAMVMLEPRVESGLESLLSDFNVEADDALVIDPVGDQVAGNPAITVVQSYNQESEITKDFSLNTAFPLARPLTVLHGTQSKAVAEPLALTMPTAWGETGTGEEASRDDDEKGGPFPLVVSVTARVAADAAGKRSDEARLIVAGDHSFATNEYRAVWGNEDFFLNSLNWLAAQTDRITIRPRLRDASRLYLTAQQRSTIFFLTLDILPVSLLALGLVVWMVRRSK
jgi:ABC-type uncharacterized transport system involved in gliding motility auxiliary subunit